MIAIRKGDCREVLRALADESVHCVVTSPPYWGLRDYGIGKDAFGLEPTYQLYVENAVAIFRQVWRVLRKDGTLWLNLGDSYVHDRLSSTMNGDYSGEDGLYERRAEYIGGKMPKRVGGGLKVKDLCGIPWRVAFALQADGWYLRQDIIWSKPNPMPESVTDRCTKAHEYLFLMSKSERYYYDTDAIKEPANWPDGSWARSKCYDGDQSGKLRSFYGNGSQWQGGETRNRRSVWEVATQPFSEAHFATFPPALIEPCIKAGTSEKGCCARCGAPWLRQVEKPDFADQPKRKTSMHAHFRNRTNAGQAWQAWRNANPNRFLGWSPSCTCNAGLVPCTVLDLFAGAGTTGLVADRLGRNAILIELNSDYAAMIERRISADAGMFAQIYREVAE